jgi:uncharacterized protein YwgA
MSGRAWIAASVDNLNNVKSWTGRIHIHKHLFIAQILGLAKVPFQFELYHFGPYSFQVDHIIADMETFGELDKQYSKPGYGPRYFTTELAESSLSAEDENALELVADQIRSFNSSDLELIATCLWVERREQETDDEVIVDRVKEIKPKYPTSQIRAALSQARTLSAELA